MKLKLGAFLLTILLIITTKTQSRWSYQHKQKDSQEIPVINQNNIVLKKKNEFDKKHLEYKKLDEEYIQQAKHFKESNQKEKTIEYYKKAIAFNPKNIMAYFELGCFLYTEGKSQEAIQYYQKAIELNPQCSQAYFNISLCYIQTKDTEKAIKHLKKLIEIKPNHDKAFRQLGLLLHKNNDTEEAVYYLKKAAQINETLDILLLLGRSLRKLDQIEEAAYYFRKAFDKSPTNLLAILELANVLNMRCKDKNDLEEALELYKKALEKDASLKSVRYNIAYTLKRLDRVEESLKYYKEVIQIDPDYKQARFSLGLAYLVLGDFDNGWPEYEYRWEAYKESPKKYNLPIWDGSNLAGKTILVCAEQGLGDTYQFVRYTQILKRQGATIVFETQKALTDIISLCDYIDIVIPRGSTIPQCDYQVYLLSLPLIFKTNIDTVPENVPYLQAKPELIEYWGKQLSQDKNFKIGLCWQGNRFYRTQALQHAVASKSIPLQLLKPIADIPGISLYSLQKKCGEDQLENIDFDIHIFDTDFDDSHGRFMDTAAVIKNLDLVISVDTSICHLAAALGVPVWNMLPKPADWRWLLKTEKTPWYSNMRLFRQKQIGDWEGLIQEVREALIKTLKNDRKKNTQTKRKQIADPIEFYDIKDMVFENTLDKLIQLNIIYEKNNDQSLLHEIKKLEKALKHMASIYKNNEDAQKLDDLAGQLCSANRELLEIEKQLLHLEDKSLFNPEVVDLTRKAQYIHNIKKHIKEQIRNHVSPR